MKTLIDIGHRWAGMLVTYDGGPGTFTVKTTARSDEREVNFEEDPDGAAAETVTQATTLGLSDLLPINSIVSATLKRELAQWLAKESQRDA